MTYQLFKLTDIQAVTTHWKYPQFDLFVGLGCSNNSESWDGGTVATGIPTLM